MSVTEMLLLTLFFLVSRAGFYDVNPPPYDVMNFAVEAPGDAGIVWLRHENEAKAQRHFREVINARRTQHKVFKKLTDSRRPRREKRLDKIHSDVQRTMNEIYKLKSIMRREGKGTFRGLTRHKS